MKRKMQLSIPVSLLIIGVAVLFMSYTTRVNPDKEISTCTGGEWLAPPTADTIKNPCKGDVASAEEGRKLYVKNCAVCHGDKGKGDGVASAGLTPKPADHSSEKCQKQSDGILFWKITNGRAPMPGYASILNKNQRWALVNYIRTLKRKSKA